VSRAKRARADERRRAAAQPPTRQTPGRTELARRRARAAKVVIAAVGGVVFAATMGLARVSFAGHPKSPPRSLAAPPRFVQVVRENLLEAGVIAPAEAPADATTSVS